MVDQSLTTADRVSVFLYLIMKMSCSFIESIIKRRKAINDPIGQVHDPTLVVKVVLLMMKV